MAGGFVALSEGFGGEEDETSVYGIGFIADCAFVGGYKGGDEDAAVVGGV